MSTKVDAIAQEEAAPAAVFSSPEPEAQRGRKRRRSPMPFAILTTAQTPSGESSTLRGRCRHRSTSLVAVSSRATSQRSFRDASHSPSRRRILRVLQITRARSQSPSRSRSVGDGEAPKRRRRRTKSRSRGHHQKVFVEPKSPMGGTVDVKKADEKEEG